MKPDKTTRETKRLASRVKEKERWDKRTSATDLVEVKYANSEVLLRT